MRPIHNLLDLNGDVWKLPYDLTLNPTVEEVMANCDNADKDENDFIFLKEKVKLRLCVEPCESLFSKENFTSRVY